MITTKTPTKAALKFRVKTVCMVDGQIVQTNVKYITTKTIYAAQRSFKLFAHKGGYTAPRADRTIMGGYFYNPENGDAIVIEPIIN